ncbi:unnamed protein product [Ilex paraguariensis]|uniref:Uncharacterized protein n=1 Tax=Ilex paraguariensis TaxID=185542 RepID=A0ABC8QWK9_9AQUA
MGGQLSKKAEKGSHPQLEMISDSQVTPDLSSYEAACRADPDLQSFDCTLQQRTSRVINTLANGVEVRSLTLDSLGEVTECLLEMNQEVVKIILDSQKDIWKNPKLFDLVELYFDNSLKTLDFCTALEKRLKRSLDSQIIIELALKRFEKEHREGSHNVENSFSKTLQELRNFKVAGNPFDDEFFLLFQSVYKQQLIMLQKLQVQKSKLDKELKSAKTWRKVSNVIFGVTFVAVLICSVVAAAIAAPPVVTALAAAASVPLGSMGTWIKSIWDKYENEIKGERAIINSLDIGTYVVIKDLDSIRVLVDKLVIEIESLLQKAEFGLSEEEGVMLVVDDIRKKQSVFMQIIEDLSQRTATCSRNVTRARTMIMHKIINNPSSSTSC